MSWAQRRKITYLVSIFFVIAIILSIFIFVFINKVPTCFDNKQNQSEVGIDCGGPCNILCRAQYSNPIVVWGPRMVKTLSNGTYNALTYVQNPNVGAGAYNAPYVLKVYDKSDVLLYQKTGKTFIPPNSNFVIFEDNIVLNDKVTVRTTLEFIGNPVWQKMDSMESSITAISKNLLNEDIKPKLLVTLRNSTLNQINNIESVAILYDENNNAIAFSKTKTDFISADGTADIVFTWPEVFSAKVVRIDIVSKVLPN